MMYGVGGWDHDLSDGESDGDVEAAMLGAVQRRSLNEGAVDRRQLQRPRQVLVVGTRGWPPRGFNDMQAWGGSSGNRGHRGHHHRSHPQHHPNRHHHRDHGIDPDSMTYEDLLTLCETIGNVNVGLPESALSSLPLIPTTNSDDITCSICLDRLKPGEYRRALPCNDTYHQECIDKWLTEEKPTCPVCQVNLREILCGD
eukprot:TRINITY_DN23711_c0_g1_i1.p3 TRINITY_DN23711_c0_g1~~TRINITY_DN23711_c0_g1_i1.p3  ORF type:complete len:199 (+),score=32.42 TRINITY_DN23711_c0_g1_i1:859-1455(+)